MTHGVTFCAILPCRVPGQKYRTQVSAVNAILFPLSQDLPHNNLLLQKLHIRGLRNNRLRLKFSTNSSNSQQKAGKMGRHGWLFACALWRRCNDSQFRSESYGKNAMRLLLAITLSTWTLSPPWADPIIIPKGRDEQPKLKSIYSAVHNLSEL